MVRCLKVERLRGDCRFRCRAIPRGAACCHSARRTWVLRAGRPAAVGCVHHVMRIDIFSRTRLSMSCCWLCASACCRCTLAVSSCCSDCSTGVRTATSVGMAARKWAGLSTDRMTSCAFGQSIAGFVANDRQCRVNRVCKLKPAIACAIRRKTWEDDPSRPTASCVWITMLAMQQQLALHVDGGRLPPCVALHVELQWHQSKRQRVTPRTHHRWYASRRLQSSLPGPPARPPCPPLPRRGRGA